MYSEKSRTPKDYLSLFLKGMGMGGADVVPGVSGGTIAFISGIYEELLDSIKAIPGAALILVRGKIKEAWNMANAPFMAILLSGIAFSVLTLAGVITHLLEHYPIPVWSFFFGLIVASVWFVGNSMKTFDVQSIVLFILATAGAYFITVATPSSTPENLPFIFFSGVIAICAMILPGISGSFILLLLGKYHFIMQALKEVNIAVILTFAMGCMLGILSFARVVSFMFRRYHNATLAVLTGFMLGSLNKVWPWKQVLEYRINSHGEQVPFIEKSVMPATYSEITGQDPQILVAVALTLVGLGLVFALETLAAKTKK
jgi:putative membrane protein